MLHVMCLIIAVCQRNIQNTFFSFTVCVVEAGEYQGAFYLHSVLLYAVV